MSDFEDSDVAKGNRHVQGVEFDDGSDDSRLNFDENNSDRDQIVAVQLYGWVIQVVEQLKFLCIFHLVYENKECI
ncbi:hypothetical protein PoB_004379300 [Plakobranchus ocellatus]|uniref:Uncharacterized protein n=1 Tax=Plakobranchus ocellatus TaxID=259542 RepID=A0AAV4BCK7_9GAST|nr:hypothetical protein PoB_004379300 [Plakobranchus ocellatus]